MGMFPVQNYGADFVNSMAATAGMFNDRKRLEMEEKRQARADETLDMQREGAKLDNQKKSADLANAQKLQAYLEKSQRMQAGQMKPEDYPTFAEDTEAVMQATPYLPNDPKDIPEKKLAVANVLRGVEQLRTLPPSNYTYSRADNIPEVNTVLDSFQSLLSPSRLGREFTDADGSVTGKPGAIYKTAGVGGFTMVSGEGKEASFVPMFSVTDAQGQPLMRQDGKPVLVPSTEGQTNGAGDRVRKITPEEMMTKAGFAYRVLSDAEKLGLHDPEKRQQLIASNLPLYMGEEGAKEMLRQGQKETGLVSFDPSHNVYDKKGNLVQTGAPKEKYVTVGEGAMLVDANTGNVVATGNSKRDTPHTATIGVGGGMEQTFQYNPKTGKYDIPLGKATAKFKAGEGGEGSKIAKVGTINAVKAALVRRYIPVAKAELKRQGRTEEDMAATEEDKALGYSVNPNAIYGALGDTGRRVYDRAATLAEQNAASGKVTPEVAVEKAIAQARKEYGLDAGGYVRPQGQPQPTAPVTQAKGMNQAPKQVASAKAITATNKSTGQRIVSYDGGKSWQPYK